MNAANDMSEVAMARALERAREAMARDPQGVADALRCANGVAVIESQPQDEDERSAPRRGRT